jgi:hypothetical protein
LDLALYPAESKQNQRFVREGLAKTALEQKLSRFLKISCLDERKEDVMSGGRDQFGILEVIQQR